MVKHILDEIEILKRRKEKRARKEPIHLDPKNITFYQKLLSVGPPLRRFHGR